MLWMMPYMVVFLALIAFGVVVIYVMFGGGIDSHNPRALFPLRTIEKEFLEQYVADGKEETGYLHRPRDGSKTIRKNQLVKIFYRYWHPKHLSGDKVNNAKGVVVVLHGLNSHSARNNTFMVELLHSGFVIAGLDHEGFGRSDGRHGYFENLHHMADDVIALIQEVRAKYKGRKVFLHGGSLGGLLVLLVLLKIQAGLIDGAVILCPVVQIHSNSRPSKVLEFIGNVLLRVAPKLPFVEGNRKQNCHPEIADAVEASKCEDPMFYNGKLRIGSGFAILEGVKYIQDKLHTIRTPYLLQHGTADFVCHVSGSEHLHSLTSSEDKTFITYPDGAHDMSNERKHIRDAVVNDFVAWLEARV